MISGAALISGIITGAYRSFQKIYGYSYPTLFGGAEKTPHLGIIPLFILRIGAFSIVGIGAFPVYSTSERAMHDILLWAIGIGIPLALMHIILVPITKKFFNLFKTKTMTRFKEIIRERKLLPLYEIFLAMVFVIPLYWAVPAFDSIPSWFPPLSPGIPVIVAGGIWVAPFIAFIPRWIVFFIVSPLLVLLRFNKVICNNCLRSTTRFRSQYREGRRYCEHCRQEIDPSGGYDKVNVTFGNIPLNLKEKIHILSDPDFEKREQPIDVSEVYIDTQTCNRRLLERFITYILNYPPKHGVQAVKIFHKGTLDNLGENFKNALQNNFTYFEALPPDILPPQESAASRKRPQTSLWKLVIITTIIGVIAAPIIGFIIGSCLLFALIPGTQEPWENNFIFADADSLHAIQATPDGGYVVAGLRRRKLWVLKFDTQEQVLWERTFDGNISDTGRFWTGHAIRTTSDEGFIIAGDIDPNGKDEHDVWVLKLNAQGQLLWERTFGGSGSDWANAVQQTPDGGYVITGATGSKGAESGPWVLKLDDQGQLVWDRTFGGDKIRVLHAIQLTLDGGYLVAGSKGREAWVFKLNAQGQLVWERTFGDNDYYIEAEAIQLTPDGGAIATGGWGWVFKIDAQGQLVWKKHIGITYDNTCAIQPTPDGGYVIAGYSRDRSFDHDAWVFKIDAQGQKVWQHTFGSDNNDDEAKALQPTPDGGWIITGYTEPEDSFLRVTTGWVYRLTPDDVRSK